MHMMLKMFFQTFHLICIDEKKQHLYESLDPESLP